MHILIEPNLFSDRLDKFLGRWKDLSRRKLLIVGTRDPFPKVCFKCEHEAIQMPAHVRASGEVLVEARNALKVLRMYSGIDTVEIMSQGKIVTFKQRNFTMTLPCITDSHPKRMNEALETDRLSMLMREKRRLQAEIRRIEEEIASTRGAIRIR